MTALTEADLIVLLLLAMAILAVVCLTALIGWLIDGPDAAEDREPEPLGRRRGR